jgi:hypothetical protein
MENEDRMTEGIIQKVCNKYRSRIALSIQMELIEEVNKNVSEWSKQNNTPLPRYVKLDVLIGDSE